MPDRRRLLREVHDESLGMICDLEPDSPVMVIAFGAHVGPNTDRVPPYAFVHSLLEYDVKLVFVRDHHQTWYHQGVRGVGDDIDSVAARLRELSGQVEHAVTIGSSGGAYAALLFGALLDCESHAFAPMTKVEPAWLRSIGDLRRPKQMDDLERHLDEKYEDLLPLLSQSSAPAHVYFGTWHGIDTLHAERIEHLDHVTLHRFENTDEHNIARIMRDTGELQELFAGFAERGSA